MSDTKNKILQVLNDNYMVNLFSAQAREHIANKIVENFDGKYNANQAPEGTVPIEPVELKDDKKSDSVDTKKSKVKVIEKPKVNVPAKKALKSNHTDRKRSSLRNLKK
jgi:hypothetical protein|tara:strand:+ start:447 stop:770 length:324 start_codon:yes stop_codon:yes gene_type:complete